MDLRTTKKIFAILSLLTFGIFCYCSKIFELHPFVNLSSLRIMMTVPSYRSHENYKSSNNDSTGTVQIPLENLPVSSLDRDENSSPSDFYSIDSFPSELVRLRPKLFNEVPSQFLSQYKNPCYYGRDGEFHCLPYFFLLGNPKCGTTDIWDKLLSHKDMIQKKKEKHWWTRWSRPSYNQSLHFYEDTHFTWSVNQASELNVSITNVVTGDASASAFWDNQYWEEIYPEFYDSGPPYVIADVIHAFLPDSKLIVSFRDPTTRLYSDYIYFPRGPIKSPKAFHSFVLGEIKKYEECVSSRSRRACVYDAERQDPVRLLVGLYSIPIQDWLRVYPRKQLYFVKLEEWSKNCERILPELYRFLEVVPLTDTEINQICSTKRKNITKKKGVIRDMHTSTRKILRAFYRPFVLELATILNDTRFLWDYQ